MGDHHQDEVGRKQVPAMAKGADEQGAEQRLVQPGRKFDAARRRARFCRPAAGGLVIGQLARNGRGYGRIVSGPGRRGREGPLNALGRLSDPIHHPAGLAYAHQAREPLNLNRGLQLDPATGTEEKIGHQ
ncbi:hypothetical protein DESC_660026 [Desulfosarcina cetonica]|nr:hypothetical protein DESC_660026 [Desulfosarcina cetonica]